MDSSTPLILSIAILILLSGYFSATETAFTSLNKIRIKSMASSGSKRAAQVLKLYENFDTVLSTILIGNNIVNIAAASLATTLFIHHFGDAGVTLSTIFMTIAVLIFGEVSPKSMAKESPESFAMFSAPFIKFLSVVFMPINYLFIQLKKLLSKIITSKSPHSFTEEELITIVEEAEIGGGIESGEGDLIRSAIDFYDLDVDEILTPRVDVVAVSKDMSIEEIENVFLDLGYSRLPVYKGNIDCIIGVINQKDFYAMLHKKQTDLSEIIKDVLYVVPNMKISELFTKLQKTQSHIAVVIDEFGGTMGIITLEDILEELVGEIWDEHDEIVHHIVKKGENTYIISCDAELDEMFKELSLDFRSEDYDATTVSGWVTQEIGRIPSAGDTFQYENLDVTVTKTDHKRVLEIMVVVNKAEEEE